MAGEKFKPPLCKDAGGDSVLFVGDGGDVCDRSGGERESNRRALNAAVSAEAGVELSLVVVMGGLFPNASRSSSKGIGGVTCRPNLSMLANMQCALGE